jgi:hypothetical protein
MRSKRLGAALAALAFPLTLGLLVLAAPFAAAAKDPFQLLSVDEVEKLLGQPNVHVYDANPREVYEKGHLPGAVFVKGEDLSPILPRQKDAKLVFYCANPK